MGLSGKKSTAKAGDRTLTLADAIEVLNKYRYRSRHWSIDHAGGDDPLRWALGIAERGYDPSQDAVLHKGEAIGIAQRLLREAKR